MYSAFAIPGPFPGFVVIVFGTVGLFTGDLIFGSIIIAGGLCLLLLNGYLDSVANIGRRGESISSNGEKVVVILAMIIAIIFGFVVKMAWEMVKMAGKILMDVLNGK